MTVKIDERVARCFGHLRTQEYAPLLEYLKAVRAEVLEIMVIAVDDHLVRKAQGKAEILKDLIGNIENADVLIGKLKR